MVGCRTSFGKSKYFKNILVTITFSLVCCFESSFALSAAGEELIDEIVAVVNTTPVLHSEVQAKVKGGQLILVSDFPADEKSPEYERALQDAINYTLIMDKIDELDVVVSDDELESQIDEVLKGQNLTREGLLKFLEQDGKTLEEYKSDFKKQMLLRRFQGRVIAPLIKITDKDIQTYYLKKSGATSDALKLTLRQILIRIPEDANDSIKAAKQSLSDEVYKKLAGGMEFAEAVKIYSDGPDARENGGLMEDISLNDLNDSIRAPVEKLAEGEYTAPIKTALGFHIFFLVEKNFAGSDEFVAQKQQLEYELRTQELNTQTRRWIQETRQKAKIEVLKKK